MVELNQIPHIDEIAHHGVFHGAAEKKPATFQERSASQNKIVPSLEEAIRRAYAAVEDIRFENRHYRTDIGRK